MKFTDREIAWCNTDPIVKLLVERYRRDYPFKFYGDLLVDDACALQVVARKHTLAALDADEAGHYGSVKYHDERAAELKEHWQAIERARDGERRRIAATLKDTGYVQEDGKIKLPLHEKGKRS